MKKADSSSSALCPSGGEGRAASPLPADLREPRAVRRGLRGLPNATATTLWLWLAWQAHGELSSRNGHTIETFGVVRRYEIGELDGAGGIRANTEPTPIDQVGRALKQVKQTAVTGDGQIHRTVGCTGHARKARCGDGPWLLMFHHIKDLFRGHVGQGLSDAGRPFDAYQLDVRGIPEAEIGPQLVLAPEAATASNLSQLPAADSGDGGVDAHLGPNRRTVRHGPDQFDREPTVAVAVVAVEVIAPEVPSGREQVQEAVVVIVRPSNTPGITVLVDRAARGDLGKSTVAVVMIKEVYDGGHDACVSFIANVQVQPAVVVIVAPGATKGVRRGIIHHNAVGDASERAVSVVVVKEVFLTALVSHEQIQKSIVVIVAPGTTVRVRDVGGNATGGDPGEGAIAVVVIEPIRLENTEVIVGNQEEVRIPVIVVIAPGT